MDLKRIKKDNRQPPFSVGGISILMVFVMLCLTTFGILTLVTARAEMRLTEKNASSVSSYYSCKTKTQDIVAEIDTIVKEALDQGKTDDEMMREMRQIDGVAIEIKGTEKTVDIAVSDGGVIGLQTQLIITEDGAIAVAGCRMTNENNFVYDTAIEDLWQG